jgi:hypothetical protein
MVMSYGERASGSVVGLGVAGSPSRFDSYGGYFWGSYKKIRCASSALRLQVLRATLRLGCRCKVGS